MLLLLAALVAAVAGALSVSSQSAPSAVAADPSRSANGSSEEIEQLRTKFSRTVQQPDGSMRTTVSAAPLHFRENGEWQPVDTALEERTDGSLASRATGYDVAVPESLSEPVAVDQGGDGLSFALRGAGGDRSTAGSTATFEEALPGVDVRYTAGADLVKEDLVLDGPAAQRSFAFDIDPTSGLTPRLADDGGVELRTGGGEVAARIAPPTIRDAAGESSLDIAYALRETSGGWVLGLDADTPWLRDGDRAWPVTIDPTITFAGSADTYMASGSPVNGVGGADAKYGPTGWFEITTGGDRIRRSMLRFNVANIPANAVVTGSSLKLHGESNAGAPTDVNVHRLTRDWTTNATWNKFNGTTAWTTPGGDYSAIVDDTVTVGTMGWYSWGVGNIVADWVSGASANYGFLLKGPSEAAGVSGKRAVFDSRTTSFVPTLDVVWEYPTGTKPQWTYDTTELPDGSRLKVNVATGNLILENNDVQIPGQDGLNLNLQRTYNNHTGWNGLFGKGWLVSGGDNVWTSSYSNGNTIFIHGPGDVHWRFRKRYTSAGAWDGTWISPPEVNATLTLPTGGRMLTFADTGQKWWFDNANAGNLTYQESATGKRITYAYGPTQPDGDKLVTTITDTNNKTYTYARDAHNYVTSITESGTGGRVWRYTYSLLNNSPVDKRLATYTDPAGKTTTYDYANGYDLERITDSAGNRTKITYSTITTPAYLTKAASIQRMTNTDWANPVGPKTTFAYAASKTTITNTTGVSTMFFYDNRNDKVYAPDTTAPTVAQSLPAMGIAEQDGAYSKGVTAYRILSRSTDDVSGVASVMVKSGSGTTVATKAGNNCITASTIPGWTSSTGVTKVCDRSFATQLDIPTAGLPQGKTTMTVTAQDGANLASSPVDLPLIIDRTPPSTLGGTGAVYLPGLNGARVRWSAGTDPVLPDGTAGSGVETTAYRYSTNGSSWTAWATTDTNQFDAVGVLAGASLQIQLYAVDNVGNSGATSSSTVTVSSAETDAPDVDGYGPLFDLDGRRTKGDGLSSLTVDAFDDGVGINRVSAKSATTELAAATIACSGPRQCPAEASSDLPINLASLSEGKRVITAQARDADGNVGIGDDVTVFVDRTGPSAATDVRAVMRAGGSARVSWDESSDPTLADGSAGSDREDLSYSYRYKVGSGSWSALTNTDDNGFTIPNASAGQAVSVEVQALDEVGNVGNLRTATATVEAAIAGDASFTYDDADAFKTFQTGTGDRINCNVGADTPNATIQRDYVSRKTTETNIFVQTKIAVYCESGWNENTVPPRSQGEIDLARRDAKRVTVYVTPCLQVNDTQTAGWRNVKCEKRQKRSGMTKSTPWRLTVEDLCAAGRWEYRAQVTATADIPLYNEGRPVALPGSRATYTCNSPGAWRRTAMYDLGGLTPSGRLGNAIDCPLFIDNTCDPLPAGNGQGARHGFEAHHIVPAGEGARRESNRTRAAAFAQSLAYACGIKPNAKPNGVWLRGSSLKNTGGLSADDARRRLHSDMHNSQVYSAIARRLLTWADLDGNCASASSMREELALIKSNLAQGKGIEAAP